MHDFEETLAATNRSAAILAAETFCWSEIWKFRNVGHVELAAARMAALRFMVPMRVRFWRWRLPMNPSLQLSDNFCAYAL